MRARPEGGSGRERTRASGSGQLPRGEGRSAWPIRLSVLAALLIAACASIASAQDAGTPAPPPQDEPIPPPPGSGGDQAVPVPDEVPTPTEQRLQLVVIDAAVYGIDAVVGRHVTAQMRATGDSMGYAVLAGDATVAAAQSLRMPYPPAPADLWRVTYASRSHRGAFARVWAESGQYVVEISVASLDGTGPFFARGTGGASDLRAVVDRLLREALPPPSSYRTDQQQTDQTTTPQQTEPTLPDVTTAQPDPAAAAEQTPERRRRRVRLRRFHLAIQTEAAFGTSQDSFYNHLIGLRADYRISREILFGAYVAYANLRGKDGRSSNLLFMLQVENRVRVSSGTDITVPLRLGLGYLPFNGPVIRLSGGLNIPLSRSFQLGIDILTPTFWVLPDRTAVSLDVGVELIYRL